jgi:diguanylate cyclase (GGDEF)-like protein
MPAENPEQPLTPEQLRIAELEARVRNLEQENEGLKEEIKELEDEVKAEKEVSTKDHLTRVLNRRGLTEAIKTISAQRSANPEEKHNPGAILVIDIDDFKAVNDVYGHPEGDRILREAAEYLEGSVRGGDLVARIGGEEFAIVFYGADGQRIYNKFFDKENSRSRIGFKTELGGIKYHVVTFSGGVTTFQPEENINNLDAVISRADTALYASKRTGKDRITIFVEDAEKNSNS